MDVHAIPYTQLQEGYDQRDNWSGLTDPVERRKRQNRLHQRAWRRRKAAQATAPSETQRNTHQNLSDANEKSTKGYGVLVPPNYPDSYRLTKNPDSSLDCKYGRSDSISSDLTEDELAEPSGQHNSVLLQCQPRSKLIAPLIPYISDGRPPPTTLSINFPLSLDHRLITLIQYNVLRATVINMTILSLLSALPSECGAALSLNISVPPLDTIPSSLSPTLFQRSVPHEAWIDCVPSAAMRDNLILNHGKYDTDDLCCDMLGGLYEGFDDVEKRGIIVWSDPWVPDGWEVTEGFAVKWTFLLKGCRDLIEASNRWRARRGEEDLVVEV